MFYVKNWESRIWIFLKYIPQMDDEIFSVRLSEPTVERGNEKREWVWLVWFRSRLADFALLFGKRQIALSPLDVRTSGDMGQERRKEEVSLTVGGSFAWFPTDLAGGRNIREAFDRRKQHCSLVHDTTLDFINISLEKEFHLYFFRSLCVPFSI